MMNHKSFISKRNMSSLSVIAITLLLALLTMTAITIAQEAETVIWTEDSEGNLVDDFPPNTDVYLHGTGFNPNTQIDITITRPDGVIQNYNSQSDDTGYFLYIYDLNGVDGEYLAEATDGTNYASVIFYDCADPDCECEDNTDLINPTGVKYQCSNTEPDEGDGTGITVEWGDNCDWVNWTSDHPIHAIISKEATERYVYYPDSTSGTINKTLTQAISHITFCVGEDPCLSHSPPTIVKTVSEPKIAPGEINHPNPYGVDYFIQNTTEIDVTVTDVDQDFVEVYYKTWSEGETEPVSWTFWFDSDDVTHDPIIFDEQCVQYLNIKAIDDCNVSYDNESFCVDNRNPTQTVEFGEPKWMPRVGGDLIGIGANTPVWLNSSDFEDAGCCGVGSASLTYRLYLNQTYTGIQVTVYDNQEGDTDDRFGYISVMLYDWESCLHEIHFACEDYFGNGNDVLYDYNHIDFWVDAEAPSSETAYSTPNFYEDYFVGYTWLNCDGVKYINVTDTGCMYPGMEDYAFAGVHKVEWKVGVDEDLDYEVDFSYNGTVYDNDPNDMNDTYGIIEMVIPFNEDCLHIVEHTVYDYFGNMAYMPKQHVKVDCTPPEIIKTVEGTLCEQEPDQYGHDVWCVTMDTYVNFSITDFGCYWQDDPAHTGIGLQEAYYRVWDMVNGWSEPMQLTISGNYAEGSYQFTEECKHYFEIVAIDLLGNTAVDNETFYVDETPPKVEITVGEPNCESDDDYDYCVNFSTLIKLEAWDRGCCNDLAYVMYNVTNDDTGQYSGWQPVPFESDYGFLDYYFDEECNHTIELIAGDCLGNENYTSMKFHVDEQAPGVDITIGDPYCFTIPGVEPAFDSQQEMIVCVNFSTVITLEAWEQGCCDQLVNVSYMIIRTSDDSSTGWIPIEIDPETQTATLDYQFDEECEHVIIIYAEDCLGNNNQMSVVLRVDESEPGVDIEVGEPNCESDDDYDYCVNFSTPINLSAWERGCCDELAIVMMNVTNDDTGVFTGWQYIDASYTYYFQEECNHTIELMAEDCLGNINYTSMKFHVDEKEPGVEINIGLPLCEPIQIEPALDTMQSTYLIQMPVYCINFSSIITLSAWEQGCCDQLVNVSYRIHTLTDQSVTAWMPITIDQQTQTATLDYQFDEECEHIIELYAEDCLGNINMTAVKLHVDESKPTIDVNFEGTICEPSDDFDYCITTETDIYITIEEQGCCDILVNASFRIGTDDGWGPWIPMEIGSGAHDAGVHFRILDECNHTIEIKTWDCLMNENSTTIKLHVDDQEPGVDISVGDPNCFEDEEFYCVNLTTPITLSVWERGCCDELINASYRVYNESQEWGPWIDLPIDEATQTATLIYLFQEECNHAIEIYAMDCLGHENSTTTWFAVDETPPSIDVELGDDNCESDDDYDYCIRTDTPIYIDIHEEGCCNILINASYRIMNESGWGPWIDLEFEGDSYAFGTIYIEEECNHTLEIKTWDCVGNENSTIIKFHVDDSAPEIIKTVGDPNIPTDFYWAAYTGASFAGPAGSKHYDSVFPADWVKWTATNCYQDTIGAPMAMWNETMFSSQVYSIDMIRQTDAGNVVWNIVLDDIDGHWQSEAMIVIASESEPLFMLRYHSADGYPTYQYYDGGWSAPSADVPAGMEVIVDEANETFEFIIPEDYLLTGDYWITCDTEITIDINDLGCCDQLMNASYRINEGEWVDILDMTPLILTFDEDCMHTLEIQAWDCLDNYVYDMETFYVDCTPPESHKTFCGPTYPEDLNENGTIDNDIEQYYWLQDHGTQIFIHASENMQDEIICDSGMGYIYVELWWDSDVNGTLEADEMVWARIINDNDENDMDLAEGSITYQFNITDDCYHEIRWYAVDRLGNAEEMHIQPHRVDSKGPDSVKTIGEPKWWDDELGLWWVTSETEFSIKSEDTEQPCAVGVDYLVISIGHSCYNGSFIYDEGMSNIVIHDNSDLDLDPTEGVIMFNFTLYHECWWKITWYAVDLLGNVEEIHYQWHVVDNTPPHVIILKPTDGWYSPGSVIPSVVVAEDIMLPEFHPGSECGMEADCAVGIPDGAEGKAWLIDIFPEFKIIELETENFLYDSASHEFIGNVKIPEDANITDGAALFVAGAADALGNDWTSIHELIHAYVIQAIAECGCESCVMDFLADVLVDFIADRNIVFVGIDSTPPEVSFNETEAPIPEVLYPGFQLIAADIFDNLSGIESGTPCYVTLNGASLGTIPYETYIPGCNGAVIIPYLPFDLTDAELSISVYDHAGNKGMDTVIVDYSNQMSEDIPTVMILSPEDNTNHSGTLTIEIQAQDVQTATADLSVFVRLMHEEEPSMKHYATYNATTDTFFVEIDISTYMHGSILDIQAFATDEDGYTGDSDFRLYRVISNIIYDQWLGPGWNLVNIVDLCEDGIQDLDVVLDCLGDSYDWVFEVGTWNNWYRGRAIQTLTTMEEGKWYWINITSWQGVRFYLEECVVPTPPENQAPVAVNDSYQIQVGMTLNILDPAFGVLSNDYDPDGDDMYVEIVTATTYGDITLYENGTFTYDAPDDMIIVDTFTYQIYDEHDKPGNIATVTMTVCTECPEGD